MTFFFVALFACGQKTDPVAAADTVQAAAPAFADSVPTDATSLSFANHLTAAEIKHFTASDNGAKLIYDSFDFKKDATWLANGAVIFGDEKMECTESGVWVMEKASAPDTAMVDWTITATNCEMRDNDTKMRGVFTITGDSLEIAYR